MATTTNYGWETPDDTDLVKDGAAAIRTLGSSIDTTTKNLNPETTTGDIAYRSATANTNTRLAIGTTGQVLTVAAGVPSWATPTDQTPLTTKGDVFTFSTVDARLGVGANGTVLTADSAETTGLKWAAPAGGGKVLQVVQTETSSSTSVTSATFTDSGLSGSITPSSASSKILVMTMQPIAISRNSNPVSARFRLLRNSTTIWDGNGSGGGGFRVFAVAVTNDGLDLNALQNISYLDSPNTTSSITYKTQMRVQTASDAETVTAQASGRPSTIILMEIGA
jgi:hypothetical protein